MSQNSALRVAIAGLGTVGAGTAQILEQNADLITARSGRAITLVAVSSRAQGKDRGFDQSGLEWCTNSLDLVDLDQVDVIVEAIGGSEGVARELVEKAIAAGKHVVTANKALLAEHGHTLGLAASKANVALGYEAAVTGGIPAIKGLREGLAANRMVSVHGIMNGTCNYIMTEMREKGLPFDDVLKVAQDLGYAEADPSFDVDGIDAAHKLALVASLAFGSHVDFSAVNIKGIRTISAEDAQFASNFGYVIKLITSACLVTDADGNSKLAQSVRPAFVQKGTAIGGVDGVDNAVLVTGDFVGQVMFRGPGAGGGPTGSAVVSDLVDIAREIKVPFLGQEAADLKNLAEKDAWMDVENAFYLRLSVADQAGVLAKIAGSLGDAGISIDSMVQKHADGTTDVAIMAIKTHKTTRRQIQPALDKLEQLDEIIGAIQSIDILDI